MKLVFIYGPPASSKLTVAIELSKITKFKLFHNHIVNDALDEIFDSKDDYYWKVGDELKWRIIEAAAKHTIRGVIFTMVYANVKGSYRLPKKIKTVMEKNKGKVYFVRLKCEEKKLLQRVRNRSRRSFGKISSRIKLKEFMKKYNPHAKLPFKNQLVINNTKTPAKEVAKQIKKHYKL